MSAPGAGGISAMLSGNIALPTVPVDQEQDGQQSTSEAEAEGVEISAEEKARMEKLQQESEALMEELNTVATAGAKIVDKKDGKTIGRVISSPASGTSIILAQMRLDEMGLLDSETAKWSQTNRIVIGDGSKEFRFLPYMPIWWPDIDRKTG
eukprot:738413_1